MPGLTFRIGPVDLGVGVSYLRYLGQRFDPALVNYSVSFSVPLGGERDDSPIPPGPAIVDERLP